MKALPITGLLGLTLAAGTAGCGDNSSDASGNDNSNESENVEATTTEAPVAKKIDTILVEHGHERVDPYFWMRLSDEQKESDNPDAQTQDVLDYLNAENAYKEHMLAPIKGLRETLYNEMVGRIKEDDETYPFEDNGYTYWEEYKRGLDYEIIWRAKLDDQDNREMLLNVNDLAQGHDYYAVGDYEVSPNNKVLGYAYDDVSRRQYKLVFKNLETGEMYPETIENVSPDLIWSNSSTHVFYVTKDPVTLRENKVWRHELGADPSEDVLVHEETDETFYCEVSKAKNETFIFIDSYSTISTEHRQLMASDAHLRTDFRVIQPREDDLLYSVRCGQGKDLYILTNYQAPNFQIMISNDGSGARESWKPFIPHREDTRVEDIEVFREYLVITERTNGLTRMRVMKHDKSDDHYIEFDEETYSCGVSVNMEYGSKVLRYGYSSLKMPSSLYDYDMAERTAELLKSQEVVGGHNPEDYVTERVWAPAPDGEKVPVSLVYKKGLKKDGSNPLLLYGYGSYGVTIPDGFKSDRLSLIDRGFIFAIAHIRGSEYLGRGWYEDGKKFTKMNTFTDFIAAGEYLIKNNYTSSDKLMAQGGSAGGLLMGAVINIKPEIFKGIIAAVPFVDVVSTMLDESIPLTTGEFDEWGNPKNEEYYKYMLSYSPYDQVEAKDYPNMLVTTGYWDSQVQYWEPAKWVAKLRDVKTDDNLLLMDCNMSTGHGGASGRYEAYKEKALEYGFLLHILGINE